MSEPMDPSQNPTSRERPPLTVVPLPDYARPAPAPGTSPVVAFFRWLFRTAFMMSVALNLLLAIMLSAHLSSGSGALYARFHSGKKDAKNKIAIVKVEGVIMEGLLGYAFKQIEEAADDNDVKAVVLHINSPGGSITASDELHRRFKQLRDGTTPGKSASAKPLVVSMGSLAASGGYYIAMPSKFIVAERSTITGSIGVYASFLNISKLADDYGFTMETIKAGDVKDSGSMFKKMKPEERYLWQEMVNHAYDQFLAVVEEGRPDLKGKLRDLVVDKDIVVKDDDGKEKSVHYKRRRADGGIYTADKALELGLIDKIGYLEDAIDEASKLAGLGSDYKAIYYDRPPTLRDVLLSKTPDSGTQLDPKKLAQASSPRLWYLTSHSELAGFLTILGRE